MIPPGPPRHTYHADGCDTEVAPELFMCPPHWSMVPPALRQAIKATYRPGQEIDKVREGSAARPHLRELVLDPTLAAHTEPVSFEPAASADLGADIPERSLEGTGCLQ